MERQASLEYENPELVSLAIIFPTLKFYAMCPTNPHLNQCFIEQKKKVTMIS